MALSCFIENGCPISRTDKALILFHRGHEHSGRWQETVDSLDLDALQFLPGMRAVTAIRPAIAARQTAFWT